MVFAVGVADGFDALNAVVPADDGDGAGDLTAIDERLHPRSDVGERAGGPIIAADRRPRYDQRGEQD
jgi:hypothetical protein